MYKLYAILLRQKFKVAIFVGCTFVGVVLFALLAPRTYRSQAKLLVRLGRENVALDPTSTFGQGPVLAVPNSREEEINSVIEVLQSRVLVKQVVDALGPAVILGDKPFQEDELSKHKPMDRHSLTAHAAVRQMEEHLIVEAPKKSNIIEISYTATDPDLAQKVVDMLIDGFLEHHVQLYRTPQSYQFLSGQTGRMHSELSVLEEEIATLKQQTGLYDVKMQREILVRRIGTVEDSLLQTTAELKAVEKQIDRLKDRVDQLPATQVTARVKGANAATDSMRAQLFGLQVKELELLSKHPKAHPSVQLVRKQVSEAKKILDQESDSREQVTIGPHRLYEEAHSELLKLTPIVESLRAKKKAFEKQLDEQQNKLKDLETDALRLAKLQRRIDVQDKNFRKYAETVEQAHIDQALRAEKISNIGIVQPASYEIKPLRPRTSIIAAIGLVFAIFGGVAVAVFFENMENGWEAAEVPTHQSAPQEVSAQASTQSVQPSEHDRPLA